MTEADENWMAYMATGPMHEMMASWDGSWKEEVKVWMEPGAEPMINESYCVNNMIMGGRYQESNHTGDFNGMPFEGRSILGYDNAMKKFVSTWVDNMGSGIMYLEGTWNEELQTIEFAGSSIDPATGKKMNVKETFRIVDERTQVMEMFMVQDDEDVKTMEITFTRE